MRALLGLVTGFALIACGGDKSTGDDDVGPDASVTPLGAGDPLEGLPTGGDQWTALCAKGYGDMISAKFCAGKAPPKITSLKELQTLLGLQVVRNPTNDPAINANVRVTLTGHSTGIGLRHVTPLNPRAFLMTTPNTTAPNASYQVMGFARGEPFVELVANDAAANTLRFFLVRFHPACEPSCNWADMLTSTVESGWTDYTLYDDATIANTTVDCATCHQPAGPGSKKMLRMQELANPWAHWFYIENNLNRGTIVDFHTAHGTEDYAGIPNAIIDPSRPIALQQIVTNNGFGTQPNVFDSAKIEVEVTATGSSATWSALYAKSVAGNEIAPPYYRTPQTDPVKTAAMVAAYQQTVAGTLARDQMPDIRGALLDAAASDMSIRPMPGLDGRGILVIEELRK